MRVYYYLLIPQTGKEFALFELNSVQQLLLAILFMQPLLMMVDCTTPVFPPSLAVPLRYFPKDGGFACRKSGRSLWVNIFKVHLAGGETGIAQPE